jgi:hypothetical protein
MSIAPLAFYRAATSPRTPTRPAAPRPRAAVGRATPPLDEEVEDAEFDDPLEEPVTVAVLATAAVLETVAVGSPFDPVKVVHPLAYEEPRLSALEAIDEASD